jgi:hypothetical protein
VSPDPCRWCGGSGRAPDGLPCWHCGGKGHHRREPPPPDPVAAADEWWRQTIEAEERAILARLRWSRG